MRREEFVNDITDWDDLVNFCREWGYDNYVENVYSDDSLDDVLDEFFSDMMSERRWYDVKEAMDDIPQGYDWYYFDWGDCYQLDGYELEETKGRLLEELDEDGFFDEEDDEEECEEAERVPEYFEPCEPDEDAELIDIGFFVSDNANLVIQAEKVESDRKRVGDALDAFCSSFKKSEEDPEDEVEAADLTGLLFSA